MRINGVETYLLRTNTEDLATSYGEPAAYQEHVLVKITVDGELAGWGEASVLPNFTGENGTIIKAAIDSGYAPLLLGQDPRNISALHRVMRSELPHNTAARAGIDIALHDLLAKIASLPLYHLLGGRSREQIAAVGAVGIKDPGQTAREAYELVKQGFQTLKLKVGANPARDVEAVRLVREAVGPAVNIRIDGNQGYDVPTAISVLSELRPVNLQYVEQPVPGWDVEGMAKVRQVTGVRIAADEALHSVPDAMRLIRHQAADAFVIKLIKLGGIYYARQVAALAEHYRIVCTFTSPFELAVGGVVNVHLGAAVPNLSSAVEVIEDEFFINNPAAGLKLRQGFALLPEIPGTGAAVDEKLL